MHCCREPNEFRQLSHVNSEHRHRFSHTVLRDGVEAVLDLSLAPFLDLRRSFGILSTTNSVFHPFDWKEKDGLRSNSPDSRRQRPRQGSS